MVKEIHRIVKSEAPEKECKKILKSIERTFHEGRPEREWILEQLAGLINYARTKIMDSNTPASERIKWSRVLIQAASACNITLRDRDIAELEEEIERLESTMDELD